MDYFPQSRRETNLMLFGLRIQIVQELSKVAGETVPKFVVERLKTRLYEEFGIDAPLAYWVIQEWAGVLGKEAEVTLPAPVRAAPMNVQAIAPSPAVKSRGYFQVILLTAFFTAGILLLLFWGQLSFLHKDDQSTRESTPSPAPSETGTKRQIGKLFISSNNPDEVVGSGNSPSEPAATSSASASIPTHQERMAKEQQERNERIKNNSRFIIQVRDAYTDKMHDVYIYSSNEVSSVEPKNWKLGKKGDPIYKGVYEPFIQDADGNFSADSMLVMEYRFNMNKNPVFTSKKNNSVLILTNFDVQGDLAFDIYQLVDGKIEFITIEVGDKFSEDLVPDDLMN